MNKSIKNLLRKRIEIKKEITYLNKKLEKILESGRRGRNTRYIRPQSIKGKNYEEFIKIFIIYKKH